MSKYIRTHNGLYIDGRSKVGDITDYTAPVLEILTEEFRAGGMDMPVNVEMGMAGMTASWVTGEDPDVFKLFGVVKNGQQIQVFVRGALKDEHTGDVIDVVDELHGKITKIDRGTYSSGGLNLTTYEMKLTYYRYEQAGETIHEIDPRNLVRVIDGVDQLAAERAALGF